MPGRLSTPPIPLLMLPGTLCDARVFKDVRDRLPGGREITTHALVGGGDAATLARTILDDAPPAFAVLGFSLGGIVALELALAAPQRIGGLALLAATARPVAPERQAARRAAGAAFPPETATLTGQLGPSRRTDRALGRTLAKMAGAFTATEARHQLEVALTRRDNRARLGTIGVPALVLGGADDPVNPPELQAELAGLLPAAELAMIPGAGHYPTLEAPDPVAAAITRWLDRVDAAAHDTATTTAALETI